MAPCGSNADRARLLDARQSSRYTNSNAALLGTHVCARRPAHRRARQRPDAYLVTAPSDRTIGSKLCAAAGHLAKLGVLIEEPAFVVARTVHEKAWRPGP